MKTTSTYLKFVVRKLGYGLVFTGLLLGVYGKRPPLKKSHKWIHYGIASYYSDSFNGKLTSTGDVFSNADMTAASNTLPLNTYVRVTNRSNGKWVMVRINDRMNIANHRLIDLSQAAAKRLGMIHRGITRVSVGVIPQKFYRLFNVTPDDMMASLYK